MKPELPTLLEIKRKAVTAKTDPKTLEIGLNHFYWRKIKDINEFDNLWCNRKIPSQIQEYLTALSESYGFIHFSLDCLEELSKEKPSNDHVFLVSYFYYSLIHNTKKTLDILALIIKTAYNLGIRDEWCDFDTSRGNKFFIYLEKANKKLYSALLSEFQDWIVEFSKERTLITHKRKWPIMPEDICCHGKKVISHVAISTLHPWDRASISLLSIEDRLKSFSKVKEILILVCGEINKKFEEKKTFKESLK